MPDILREAETDLAELAGLPGAIRDKVKAGVAELTSLRDAIDAEIARHIGNAKATLESLRVRAPLPAKPDGDVPPPPPIVEDVKPSLIF